MINGIGPLETSHVTNALAGSKLDQVEQLADEGNCHARAKSSNRILCPIC